MKIYTVVEQWCNGASTGTEYLKSFLSHKAVTAWLTEFLGKVISNRLSEDANDYGHLGPEYVIRTDFEHADIPSLSRFSVWLAKDDESEPDWDDVTFAEHRRVFDVVVTDVDETDGGAGLDDRRCLALLSAEQQSTLCTLICREIDDATEAITKGDELNCGDLNVMKAWKENLSGILKRLSI